MLHFPYPDSQQYNYLTDSMRDSLLNTPEEQITTKQKRSRVHIRIPGDPKLLYKGTIVLEKFTNDMIVVSLIGTGFPKGVDPKSPRYKDKLFPIEGKIIIEEYNIYDNR